AAIHIDSDSPRFKLPFGMRQLAGCDRAMSHEVVIGAVFLDYLAGEGKRIRTGEHIARAAETKSSGADHVIERSYLGADVVVPMAGLDVFIIGPAVENYVAFQLSVAGCGIVSDFVGIK